MAWVGAVGGDDDGAWVSRAQVPRFSP